MSSFPKNFTWGAATASYQIEGAADAEGKGRSVWDMMCRQPGRVFDGHTGDVAVDHYHRYAEDVGLMRQIGLQAYRFSISWPRVFPEGTGAINDAGLAFYDRLTDALLAAGITPWVTLFHWDYPYALFCRGGWLNPESPRWFADYTVAVVDRLSDRVAHWMTLNEPQCFIGLGHWLGKHAPGERLGWDEVLLANHHALMAHGLAVQTIRERAKTPPVVGWAPAVALAVPASESAADIEAARRATMEIIAPTHWTNTWYSDPVIFGHYPEDGLRAFGSAAPRYRASDFEIMRQPLDFYGANIYNSDVVRADASGKPEPAPREPGYPAPNMPNWVVEPRGLYWGPRFLAERYHLPIVITENGMSGTDWVSLDGQVHDPQRIDFVARYLRELRRAGRDGVDVRGYFLWSLIDNFEWAEGFQYRFGLIHVDHRTQARTIKDSGHWYRGVIESNGAALPE